MQKLVCRWARRVALTALAAATTSYAYCANVDVSGYESRGCTALENQTIGTGHVLKATLVRPPFTAEWPGGRSKERVDVPFCRIEASASAVPGSDIRFEVWLPTHADWNGRFLGVGAGGSWGAINQVDLATGVNRGFASVATDNGHRGYPGYDISWALGSPEKVVDFGYRAHHLATEAGKALVTRYYGRVASRAYYFGCSQGGHKGMMAAQRYPADYDGIAVGAPVYSWVNEMTTQAWNFRALTQPPESAISEAQMQALSAAAVHQCGGADGLIADARQCEFDPGSLLCATNDSAACLSELQVAAVRKMYGGPQTSTGVLLNRGLTRGSESNWKRLWVLETPDPLRSGSWFGVFRYMVFENPNWEAAQLDFDRDPQLARNKLGPVLDPDDPDLGAFQKRGGKLIVYHGWSDDMVPAETSTDYHAAVVARLGLATTDRFYRLFMVPGLAHCSGGEGADVLMHSSRYPNVTFDAEHDLLVALQRWVERDQAPSHLIASKYDESGAIERTRLLCPEPQAAQYRGSGEPTDARNWECIAPSQSNFPGDHHQ